MEILVATSISTSGSDHQSTAKRTPNISRPRIRPALPGSTLQSSIKPRRHRGKPRILPTLLRTREAKPPKPSSRRPAMPPEREKARGGGEEEETTLNGGEKRDEGKKYKGNDLNVSIIPHFPDDIGRLRTVITPDWVKNVVSPLLDFSSFPNDQAIQRRNNLLKHVVVEIYDVPGISSLNIVVRNILDGGVNCSRRIDRHGKTVRSHFVPESCINLGCILLLSTDQDLDSTS